MTTPVVVQLQKKDNGKVLGNDNSNRNSNFKKVLLPDSNHGTGLREHLHSILGEEYMVTNVFKPNATLGNVVGELKALSKDFIKDDYVIIVGAPGNILDRDPNYKTENDIDNITKNSTHTIDGFAGLLEYHDRPHISKWIRGENMRLEHALWNSTRSL
jgi:hypothetical protein